MLVVLNKIMMTPDVVYPVLRVVLEADRGREFHHGSPYHHTLVMIRGCLNAPSSPALTEIMRAVIGCPVHATGCARVQRSIGRVTLSQSNISN